MQYNTKKNLESHETKDLYDGAIKLVQQQNWEDGGVPQGTQSLNKLLDFKTKNTSHLRTF